MRELGDIREKVLEMPNEKKLLIEEAPDTMVRQLFEEKLKLEDNDYIKQFPEKIQKEMRKELIDMLMEQRSRRDLGVGDPDAEDLEGWEGD